MENRIVMYCAESEVIKCLASVLEQKNLDSRFVEEEQELFEYLGQDNVGLVIMEMRGMPAELERLSRLRKRSDVPIIIISEEEKLKEGYFQFMREECLLLSGTFEEMFPERAEGICESIKLMAFRAGADDFILTNCSLLELLARIDAQLRRYWQLSHVCSNQEKIYQIGELIIDDRDKSVTVHGKNVNLTPIEYKILKLLAQEQGRVFSIPQIYEAIWNMKAVGVDNTIAVHICHIREKIESNPKRPQYVKVVWGAGYKMG